MHGNAYNFDAFKFERRTGASLEGVCVRKIIESQSGNCFPGKCTKN